jgi:hypothetical protein
MDVIDRKSSDFRFPPSHDRLIDFRSDDASFSGEERRGEGRGDGVGDCFKFIFRFELLVQEETAI